MSSSLKRSSDVMAEESVNDNDQVPHIPNHLETRIQFIKQEILRAISPLCVASKNAHGIPDATTEPTKSLLPRLDKFLGWLETEVEMSPALKTGTRIDAALKVIFDDPKYHFREPIKERARQLYEKWEAQNWGRGEVIEESTDDEVDVTSGDDAARNVRRRTSTGNAPPRRDSGADIVPSIIRAPPASHPIFGEHGIMHGVVRKISARRRDYILDSRYQKRETKVYGHNGLRPGDWWPMQIVALFNGAHGAKMAGIHGNTETGAYSVVTSGGAYEDLDQDRGDVLYYSGSRSHDNTDPKKPLPSSAATETLKASLRVGKPVRVLRAAGLGESKSGSSWRPTAGIRYDGLYGVVALQLKTNMKGGLYEQFKLVRLEDQPPLDNKARPTAREVRDLQKARDDGY